MDEGAEGLRPARITVWRVEDIRRLLETGAA